MHLIEGLHRGEKDRLQRAALRFAGGGEQLTRALHRRRASAEIPQQPGKRQRAFLLLVVCAAVRAHLVGAERRRQRRQPGRLRDADLRRAPARTGPGFARLRVVAQRLIDHVDQRQGLSGRGFAAGLALARGRRRWQQRLDREGIESAGARLRHGHDAQRAEHGAADWQDGGQQAGEAVAHAIGNAIGEAAEEGGGQQAGQQSLPPECCGRGGVRGGSGERSGERHGVQV